MNDDPTATLSAAFGEDGLRYARLWVAAKRTLAKNPYDARARAIAHNLEEAARSIRIADDLANGLTGRDVLQFLADVLF